MDNKTQLQKPTNQCKPNNRPTGQDHQPGYQIAAARKKRPKKGAKQNYLYLDAENTNHVYRIKCRPEFMPLN